LYAPFRWLAFARDYFTSKLYCGSQSSFYCHPQLQRLPCYNIIARPLRNIRPPPTEPPFDAIHHTPLVMVISCKGQYTRSFAAPFANRFTWSPRSGARRAIRINMMYIYIVYPYIWASIFRTEFICAFLFFTGSWADRPESCGVAWRGESAYVWRMHLYIAYPYICASIHRTAFICAFLFLTGSWADRPESCGVARRGKGRDRTGGSLHRRGALYIHIHIYIYV